MASSAPVPQSEARRVVDTLVQTLEKSFREFNISEIVEGGSLGHGTAVPGNYDIDLVIYSRDISGDQILRSPDKYQTWLTKLDAFLSRTFGRDYRRTMMTGRSVQFKFKEIIDVDLLVSPFWKDQHELYRFLERVPKKERDNFTVCASKWQVEFFKRQPPQVKEYIRKAKAWRNEKWPRDRDGSGRPSSYLMSLLVVEAYRCSSIKGSSITQTLINMVTEAGSTFNICWDGFYEKADYSSLLPSRPRIVDPANPANNVWESGFKAYRRGVRPSNYEPGDGDSSILKANIRTIRL